MQAPNYRWVCYRCQAVNEPGTTECASCKFTASPTGAQLDSVREPNQSPPKQKEEHDDLASTVFLLFPEGLLAAFVLLASPVLLLQLITSGKLVDALFFFLAVAAGGAMLYFASRERSKWLAYAASLVLVIAGYGFVVS